MNLVADEGIDREIVERLRRDGHEVVYIAEMKPGITDAEVLDIANTKMSILVTADKDFGELVFRQKRIHAGVLLLRLEGLSGQAKAEAVAAAFSKHSDGMNEAFTVISPAFVRIRKRT